MATSNFFGYQGHYVISSTIEPGVAYWVKVNQPGTLILSSSSTVPQAASEIKIVASAELPPPPPDAAPSKHSGLPDAYALEQNYPNPFNPSTSIQFSMTKSGNVALKIFDVLGREVVTLANGKKSAGEYTV